MMGLERSTVSPSSSIMMRSTPWVEGCCGPMLMIIVSSSPNSTSMSPGSSAGPSGRRERVPCSIASSSGSVSVALLQLLGAFGGLRLRDSSSLIVGPALP